MLYMLFVTFSQIFTTEASVLILNYAGRVQQRSKKLAQHQKGKDTFTILRFEIRTLNYLSYLVALSPKWISFISLNTYKSLAKRK